MGESISPSIDLQTVPVTSMKGVGEYLGSRFKVKGIHTAEDLLYFFPFRYEDRSSILSLSEALKQSERDETYVATLILRCLREAPFVFRSRRLSTYLFEDDTGVVSVPVFSRAQGRFREAGYYILVGKLKRHRRKWQLHLHEWEAFDEEAVRSLHSGRIVPIYHTTKGLNQKPIRKAVDYILRRRRGFSMDYRLPLQFIRKYRLKPKVENIQSLHFPENFEELRRARAELIYEEFFLFQHTLARKKIAARAGKERDRYRLDTLGERLIQNLPFTLTVKQREAVEEIKVEMKQPSVMIRMLQGDVGAGKTVVALITILLAVENKRQAVLMVPTDVLARQHWLLLKGLLKPLGVEVGLLVSSLKTRDRNEVLEKIKNGSLFLIVGTHALYQDGVEFTDLCYVVIDEQHRFGVDQRKAIRVKGSKTDLLMMSATPIPRSLSMTLFGDLDMTTIHGLPTGRKERACRLVQEANRLHAYRFLLGRIDQGEQGYVIFPAIEGEKKRPFKALLREYKWLKKEMFGNISTDFLHGKIKEEKKAAIMDRFARGEIKILFATTILEVGIDNLNATVMIVESADWFGLSQLHQLRGRVGRGEKKGYCYLIVPDEIPEETRLRLDRFSAVSDGFKISELDLKMRGPGEFLGIRQSGMPEFRLGHLFKDFEILKKARKDALEFVERRKEGKAKAPLAVASAP